MPEPLKNMYTHGVICAVLTAIKKECSAFSVKKCENAIFAEGWEELELKGRMRRIAECVYAAIPYNYKDSMAVLVAVAPRFTGFEYMFFPDIIELYGQKNWTVSIPALKTVTSYSSSEFAVRPFLVQNSNRMLQHMLTWTGDKNEHVRRLASEGCRPRLPWAMALPAFKKDPTDILPILTALRDDESEYVRRSVANNLNDISKDHPELVRSIAKDWLGDNVLRDKLVKHACRTLLKQGDPEVLSLFGCGPAKHVSIKSFELESDQIDLGEHLVFTAELVSSQPLGTLRIEFGIDYQKANGSLSRKVFKISESTITERHKTIIRRHAFVPRTTRKLHPGEHGIALIINGEERVSRTFFLKTND